MELKIKKEGRGIMSIENTSVGYISEWSHESKFSYGKYRFK